MRMRGLLTLSVLLATGPAAGAGYNPPWPPGTPGGQRVEDGYVFTLDYYYDAPSGYYVGDANAHDFEVWELGARARDGRLEFSLWTNLPESGAAAPDTYGGPFAQSPGDLWITVGDRDPFAAAGVSRHAVALTSHANVVPQKYPGETWPQVTQGNLYTDAAFATGTFETYEEFMRDNDYWYWPNDRDGRYDRNSYMTLIKDYGAEAVGESDVAWAREDYWDGSAWVEAWRVTGSVSMSELGIGPTTPYALFVSSECGNDGATHPRQPVPEPAALFVLAGGFLLLRRR